MIGTMPYHIVPVTPLMQNCTLLWCEVTRQAVIVDPGGDLARIQREVQRLDLTPTRILLTHGHIDHVGVARAAADVWQIPLWGPSLEDREWLQRLPEQARYFGLPEVDPLTPDRWLTAGDRIPVGQGFLEARHTPGHTPGHLVFFDREAGLVIAGDVLFQGSVGRTDFPGGSWPALRHSIESQLWPLGDDTLVLPGHGPTTTIGRERTSNPYLTGRN
ncbi:hydroxyacylglutathione hydrolase GloC [Gammaproteobacteria bacterium]